MKKLNKLLALALAVMLTLSLCTGVFAADKIAPLADRTHTYTAYKIFTGTQTAEEGDSTLGAVKWGDGIDSENFLVALKASNAFGDSNPFVGCNDAAAVAEAMKNWADKSDNAKAFAKLAEDYTVASKGIACENGITSLEAGYYLVVDTTDSVDPDDAYNVALLQLTKKGAFKIAAKNSVPEVVKQVSDEGALNCKETHTHTKECYNWYDANNVALGDTVHYKIETGVPAEASEYEYYFFIVNDTLSDGLDYTNGSLKVFIDGTLADASAYTVKVVGQNIQVALVDAIANAGNSVVVTYDAVLNEGAVIGVEGNPNVVTVKYSNNPNEDFKPNDKPSDGFPKDDTHKPNGETPKDYTITYTSKINVYKVDEQQNPLQGAEFTLSGETLNKVLVMKEQFVKNDQGKYYKLTDGTYTTEAPTQESMVVSANPSEGGYVYLGDSEEAIEGLPADQVFAFGEVYYRLYNPTYDAGETVYIHMLGNSDLYEKGNFGELTTYDREWTAVAETADGTNSFSVKAFVDENGVVSFAGLPAGSYTLSETVVPNGYNPIADIEFSTNWTAPANVTDGTEDCVWYVAEGDNSGVSYNTDADAFEITIENKKGSTLPETGGIGTTIFYVIGGILLVGAAVLLITKKRMGAEA